MLLWVQPKTAVVDSLMCRDQSTVSRILQQNITDKRLLYRIYIYFFSYLVK